MALVSNPYSNYSNTRTATANKTDLVVMLYEAALRFIKEIGPAIEQKDFNSKGRSVDNALAIINELKMSITYNYNDELAKNLVNIYTFASREITTANVQNNSKPLEAVIEILTTLKSAWEETARVEKQTTLISS